MIQVITQTPFGRTPITITCPLCQGYMTTRVDNEAGFITHIAALLLCFACPCLSCLPYLTTVFKESNHYW